MELTLDNLIFFCNEYEYNISKIKVCDSTLVIDIANEGDEVYMLLDSLAIEFNVSFKNFDFKKYFLEEGELFNGCLTFGFVKTRKIEHELTIGELYDYMKENIKTN